MSEIARLWAGRVFGTNTGNLFVELDQAENRISGTLRLLDTLYGLSIYEITGSIEGSTLKFEGEPKQFAPGVETGRFVAKAIFTPQGHFRGQWQTSIGTAGTFELYPHATPQADQSRGIDSAIPEQLRTVRQTVGAVRLYAGDIRELVQAAHRDFAVGRAIVTYKLAGIENTQYYEEFEKQAASLNELRYLKVSIQEPEAHGINKVAVIELDAEGRNDVMVQGIHESWVIGKAEALARQLRQHEKNFVTNIRRWGVGVNLVLFVLLMLVLLPAVETLSGRASFVVVVSGLIAILVWVHRRFLPNFVATISQRKPGVLARAWPVVLSWLIGASASLAAAYAFFLLTRNPA